MHFLTPQGTRTDATDAARTVRPEYDLALLRNALSGLSEGQALRTRDGHIFVAINPDTIQEAPRYA